MEQAEGRESRRAFGQYTVAWLDVLGIREEAGRSQDDPVQVDGLIRLMEDLGKIAVAGNSGRRAEYRAAQIEAAVVGDALVLASPEVSDAALQVVALTVSRIVMYIVQRHRRFVRGAIAAGRHYHSERACFGPALMEAIHAETHLAQWPRVLVLPSALSSRKRGMYSYIKRDRSGLSHVDYLLLSSADLAVGGASKGADILPTIYRNLHDHKDGIESQVGLVGPRDRLKLLPRYYTLADYHNRFVGGISSSPGVRGSRRSKARREWELVDAIEQEALAREGYSEAETAQILSELDEIAAEFVKSLKTTRVDIRRLFKELNPR